MDEKATGTNDRSPLRAGPKLPGPVGGAVVGTLLGAAVGSAPWLYEAISEAYLSRRPLDFKPLFFVVVLVAGAVGSGVVGAVVGAVGRRPELVGALGGAIVLGAFAAALSLISGGELDLVTSVAVAAGVGFAGGILLGAALRGFGHIVRRGG